MTPFTLFRLATAAAIAALSPVLAAAQEARAAKAVNLRAGPGRDYPLVVQVGAGAPLAVQGCLAGYSWCDVVVPGPNYRGWVYAGNIAYPYQRAEVPLLGYGAVIGLPIIGFTLGRYWGDHYRDRPFYRDRGRWEHRPNYRPPLPPPRGFGPGPRPPGDGRFPGPGRPPGAGRTGDGGHPPFGRGDDHGARPDRGRPDGGRGGPQSGGRPEGGGRGGPDGHDGRPGR